MLEKILTTQFKPKRIKLADGTSEEYADLIDAYEKGIDVKKR